MVTPSTVNGWPLVDTPDPLDIEEALGTLAAEIDDDLLPVMSTPVRDATIVPSEGMLSYVTDRKAMEIYDGSIWREADRARVQSTSDLVLPDTEFRDIPNVLYRVIEHGVYYFDGVVAWSSTTADDIRFQWSMPSGTTGRWRRDGTTSNTSVSIDTIITIGAGGNGTHYISHFFGYFQITNTGFVTLQAAKNTDTTSNGAVYGRSTSFSFTRIR